MPALGVPSTRGLPLPLGKSLPDDDRDVVPILQNFKDGWIFRGVRDAKKHRLRPSIGRDGARKDARTGKSLPYVEADERRQLAHFMREGRGRYDWQPDSSLEWMVLGQHHRLPTRLLDWSESFLVAAFFAAEEPLQNREAAIYGAPPPREIESLAVDPFVNQYADPVLLVRAPHLNPRITAQGAVLTWHRNPAIDWDTQDIHRWIIPATFTFTLKGLLAFCGIHAASLFPDSADRHTEYISWRRKWGRLS